jgi:hypothetical protein
VNGARFVGLGFVATVANADPSVIAPLGVVKGLAPKVAHGLDDAIDKYALAAWVSQCKNHGLNVVPWAWCSATDVNTARIEARSHADRAVELGCKAFIANPEEPYDAHGNSSDPRYYMCDQYWDAFFLRLSQLGVTLEAVGQTSTPFFASSAAEGIRRGVVMMPQAFVGAEPAATVAATVTHAEAWGWKRDHIRPLVQVYETNGVRPSAGPYLTESAALGVGVVPYIVEQALDDSGRALLVALTPATMRTPVGGTPVPAFEKIGSQHGVAGYMKWLRAQPGVTARGPGYDANNISTWPFSDKLERALLLTFKHHDEQM